MLTWSIGNDSPQAIKAIKIIKGPSDSGFVFHPKGWHLCCMGAPSAKINELNT